MKFWKNWPYWVRGGVIGILVAVLFDAILLYYSSQSCPTGGDSLNTGQGCFFSWLELKWAVRSMWFNTLGIRSVYVLVIFSSLGSSFGWLYGKIKNRKQIINQTNQ